MKTKCYIFSLIVGCILTAARLSATDYSQFQGWAGMSGVQAVRGDFNGDGKTDIALVGGGGGGWISIPIAFSNGDGNFNVTNDYIGYFATNWAVSPGVQVVTGDFNGDGKTDIALVGGGSGGWNTIVIAFSNGDGSFNVTNDYIGYFATNWAVSPGVQVVTGDFNGDGRTDIALVGGGSGGWISIPIAFSNGDGSFNVTNNYIGGFASSWAVSPGVQVVTGDFNGDGKTDIALVGGGSGNWDTIPIAFSIGDGSFNVTNNYIGGFAKYWAVSSGVKAVVGDINGDGKTDIALVGGGSGNWDTIPVAFSIGDGSFNVTNSYIGGFASNLAVLPGVKVVSGDYNGDGKTDIALVGGPGWWTMPAVFSNGDGSFNFSNPGTPPGTPPPPSTPPTAPMGYINIQTSYSLTNTRDADLMNSPQIICKINDAGKNGEVDNAFKWTGSFNSITGSVNYYISNVQCGPGYVVWNLEKDVWDRPSQTGTTTESLMIAIYNRAQKQWALWTIDSRTSGPSAWANLYYFSVFPYGANASNLQQVYYSIQVQEWLLDGYGWGSGNAEILSGTYQIQQQRL